MKNNYDDVPHTKTNSKSSIREKYFSKHMNYNQPWILNQKFKRNIQNQESRTIIDHYEIMSFSEWASPTEEEKAMRLEAIDRLKTIIASIHPEAEVRVYGSCESDLCVPQSDIDLVVLDTMVKEEMRISALTELAYEIHKNDISFDFPSVITSTKVPIIKFIDSKTGYSVDVNFDSYSGINNTSLIKQYLKEYPLLRPLAIILKYYLKQCRLNDPWTGGIGSYTLLILVVSFLQQHTPSKGKSDEATEDENLAVILINLLKYYGREFDYKNQVISVRDGGSYLSKKTKSWENENFLDALSVEDPLSPDNDIGRPSFDINQAKISFLRGYNLLTDENFKTPHHSIVSKLLSISKIEISFRDEMKKISGGYYTHRKLNSNNPKRKFNFENNKEKNYDMDHLEQDEVQSKKLNPVLGGREKQSNNIVDFVNSENVKIKRTNKHKHHSKGNGFGNPSKNGSSKRNTSFQLDDDQFPPLSPHC